MASRVRPPSLPDVPAGYGSPAVVPSLAKYWSGTADWC